ncbi:hypothetical protein AN478_02480 [Thiohalorhabdus denitrificans]|uniref:Cytochrome c domain-containing protein n=1 Tax=Thiohalorhabdus denitrificans TaxID=381306 RepID=A0A0P9C8U4_9GAMM|nr:hypothetical protein [Thiohalorhabdus denitrificans]KPV41455.1 hypothetical protein AN478_02480 [Thiohalorhabdus denitrificans]SCY28168.1 hypothetical protein SAMN05661077_1695 [Thiohalorhabdus denitrificans]
MTRITARIGTGLVALAGLLALLPQQASAIPAFARQTEMSCNTCHAAVPKLNSFGEDFAANGYRLPNWKDKRESYGDDRLHLPDSVPLAVRIQGFGQLRSADRAAEGEEAANVDLQSPYFIKLLGGAPLTDHINTYFYGILAEKGENGTVLIEDAWLRHDDVFGTGVEAMLGQFQVSDLMFPREVRLSFQDYIPYRMAGITYERGLLLERGLGPVDLALGVVNSNGIDESRTLTASGYSRPDHSFDNNDQKSVFGRIATDVAGVGIGVFGFAGQQPNGFQQEAGNIDAPDSLPGHTADKRIAGLDLSGQVGGDVYWYLQGLYNEWGDFLEEGEDYSWWGGFAGVDWIMSPEWAFSLLYNYGDADDLDEVQLSDFGVTVNDDLANTRYDGLNLNTLTFTTSYYFASNVRGVVEANYDFQDTNDFAHREREHYLLMGLDAAF